MLYATLDEALTDIAGRSFYESARVTKTDAGYTVEDWCTGVEETVLWSYETGAQVGDVLDYSRTHEAYESYGEARHIRYNLPVAVETIDEGTPVGFTYVVAEAECEDASPDADRESGIYDCGEDHAAGWLLIATVEN